MHTHTFVNLTGKIQTCLVSCINVIFMISYHSSAKCIMLHVFAQNLQLSQHKYLKNIPKNENNCFYTLKHYTTFKDKVETTSSPNLCHRNPLSTLYLNNYQIIKQTVFYFVHEENNLKRLSQSELFLIASTSR